MKLTRHCPACGVRTNAARCCGVDLGAPFRMTRTLVKGVRGLAHGRKGLDDDTYRLHVRAVGARSTLELTRTQYNALVQRLSKLPDVPRARARVQGRAPAHA